MRQFTKPLILLTVFISLLFLASCGKDDGPEPQPEMEEVAEQPEEEPTEPEAEEEPEEETMEETPSTEASNLIADNVIIKGGTKVEGMPPAPNEAITLILPDGSTPPVVEEGFDLIVFSEADITGAYIQFKAPESSVSESYYDVDLEANQDGGSAKAKIRNLGKSTLKNAVAFTAKPGRNILDIDFGAAINPGEFCYIICVYDGAGNISAPQEVCITVSDWGGNPALVGEWNLMKSREFDEGETEIENVGEEYCNDSGCETLEFLQITFNADGTYETTERYNIRELDGDYGMEFDQFDSRGNWSFTSDNNLVLAEYYYAETDENGTEEEASEAGEASLVSIYGQEELTVSETELVLIDRADDDADGNFEYIFTTFFEKQ